jgi:hypothetical protein
MRADSGTDTRANTSQTCTAKGCSSESLTSKTLSLAIEVTLETIDLSNRVLLGIGPETIDLAESVRLVAVNAADSLVLGLISKAVLDSGARNTTGSKSSGAKSCASGNILASQSVVQSLLLGVVLSLTLESVGREVVLNVGEVWLETLFSSREIRTDTVLSSRQAGGEAVLALGEIRGDAMLASR